MESNGFNERILLELIEKKLYFLQSKAVFFNNFNT